MGCCISIKMGIIVYRGYKQLDYVKTINSSLSEEL